MLPNEEFFKARVVQLILKRETEQAIEALSQHYHVALPILRVGMPKGSGGKVGCYVTRTKTIHVAAGEKLYDPSVILHEFYHHLRTKGGGKHKGTEKYADKFVREYIAAYQSASKYSFGVSYEY